MFSRHRPSNVIRNRSFPTSTTSITSSSGSTRIRIRIPVVIVCGVMLVLLHSMTLVYHPAMFRHLELSNPVQQATSFRAHKDLYSPGFGQLQEKNVHNKSLLYPKEQPLPNPPLPVDGTTHFSACLLVMDDNPRLSEWLAYHAHVLPLQYLIVAVDPRSQTSPTVLLNQWRRQGMVIEEWTDQDFWKKPREHDSLRDNSSDSNNHRRANPVADPPVRPINETTADLQTKRDRHRGRQKYFYRTCLAKMQANNRTWVTLHDSDEFLVYNHAGGDKFEAWQAQRQAKSQGNNMNNSSKMPIRMQPSMIPPTTAQEGQMIRYIQHERAAGLKYYQSACIGIPRLQFGTAESTWEERTRGIPVQLLLPHHRDDPTVNVNGLDPSRTASSSSWLDNLDTLRWRKHAARNDFIKNALGKVLLDVSRVPPVDTLHYFMSLHRPIKSICPAPWNNEWESGLRLNHYLGSWAAYSFRDDSRRGGERSREQWEYKGTQNEDGTDDVIRPWLQGFVASRGVETVRALLRPAGVPPHYAPPPSQDPHWRLEPQQLQAILATNETVVNDNKKIAFDAWVRRKYQTKRE